MFYCKKNAVYAITDDSLIKRYTNECQFCFNAQILFKIQLLKNFTYVKLVFSQLVSYDLFQRK